MWCKSSCGENGANQMYLRIASQPQMVKKTSGNNEPFWRDLIIVCFSGIRAPSLYVLLIRIVNWGWGGWDVLEGSSGFVFSWLDAAAPT